MIVNPDKFQVMVLDWQKQKEKINLTIYGAEIKAQNSVTLLRVEIVYELNFNNHIQKQPFRGVLSKTYSENMQQIYRRAPMLKFDSNKVASQLY